MIDLIKNFYFGFGAIIWIGALHGGIKGTWQSVLAGGVLGLLVVLGGAFLVGKPEPKITAGLVCALIGAIGIAGKFVPAFLKAEDKGAVLWPAGILGLLAVVSIVLTIVGFVKK